ncbi:hypothetical protein EGW08_012454 [Elysia chlorotica]|uniref:Uncharacterized protein n=1 Tax=Elysia chlorotica TaxID=188477 RepID=A0A433TDX4_ELYCH|nr:hypothetical protein EGW08_012454 [Elysia chlorotica]
MVARHKQVCTFFAIAYALVFFACDATQISNGGSISLQFVNRTERGWAVRVDSRLAWSLRGSPCSQPCWANSSVGSRSRPDSLHRQQSYYGRGVRVDSRLAWSLRGSPCPQPCSANSSVGSRSRPDSLHRQQSYYGRWFTSEMWPTKQGNRRTQITSSVDRDILAYVTEVDEVLEYVVESSSFTLYLEHADSTFTLSLQGPHWRDTHNLQGQAKHPRCLLHVSTVRLQARSDTGQPNNSPVASFSPVYRYGDGRSGGRGAVEVASFMFFPGLFFNDSTQEFWRVAMVSGAQISDICVAF